MRNPTAILALMTALAAGSAAGQTAAVDPNKGTNAGTVITNTASASYTDPSTNTTTPASSNSVQTNVLAKHAFDITYTTGADDDGTDTVASAPAGYKVADAVPGQLVSFPYVAVNNGNATQAITLGQEVSGGVDPLSVKYYQPMPDGSSPLTAAGALKSGATEVGKVGGVYTITLAPQGDDPATTSTVETYTGLQNFYMVYTVPNVAPGTPVGASPVGSALAWDGSANVAATEQKDAGVPAYDDLWYQYNAVTLVTVGVDATPTSPTDPDGDGIDGPGTGSVVTPPGSPGTTPSTGTPGTGTPADPVSPGTPGANVPTTSGYVDPTNPLTSIGVQGDQQTAYPPADSNTLADTVTFYNVVSNTGPISDTVTLSVVAAAGNQTVVKNANGTYTITQTNADNSTTTATVTFSNATPTVPSNGKATYTVTVSYPDNDGGNPYPISVTIGVDSGNDNDTTPEGAGYTTDTVLPPAMGFGDDNGAQAAPSGPTAAPAQSPTELVDIDPATALDNVATFPMQVANPGEYNDSYDLSGYVVVPLTDGTKVLVPVVYSGTGVVDSGGRTRTVAVDLNGDGDTLDAGETLALPIYVTPVVGANAEADVSANVTVPANAAATNGTLTGANPNLSVQQQATSNYSGITLVDTNDQIQVAYTGVLQVAKFTYDGLTLAGAKPKNGVDNPTDYTSDPVDKRPDDTLRYRIIAKNTYNAPVKAVYLIDSVPTNTTFVSVLGSHAPSGPTLIYSTNGASWVSTAPTSGTTFYVAIDDAAVAGLQPGALQPGASLTMDFVVKVK